MKTLEVSEPPPTGITEEHLRGILDRRAAAVEQGDEAAFLADLDQSNAELIERQKMVFSNLRQLEFDELRYVTNRVLVGLAQREADGAYVLSPVIAITKLTADRSAGAVAPAEAFQYKVALRDGSPVVTDIVAITRRNAKKLRHSTGIYANAPWNTTPLQILNVDNVWLAGDDSVSDLEQYLDAARGQVRDVEALWGDRTRFPGYVLFLTRKRKNFRTWFDSNTPAKFEGYEMPLQGVRSNGEPFIDEYAGSRIVVNLESIAVNDDDPVLVMRHELAHAITSRATSVDFGLGFVAARWAVEGFARWVENLNHPDRQAQQRAMVAGGVRAGTFTGTLPRSETFYDDDIHFNYAVSASVFSFAERVADRDAAVEFYAQVIQYTDLKGEPLVTLPAFDAVCTQVLDMDSEAFLQRWAGFVRNGA